MVDGIDVATLRTLLEAGSGVPILDVRSAEEVQEDCIDHGRGALVQVHIDAFREDAAGAVAAVQDAVREMEASPPVVVVCWEGDCSQEVAGLVESAGLDAVYLEGGMAAWSGGE